MKSLPSLLFVLFLGLKLTGNIAWSWWWVFAPLWVPILVAFVIAFVSAFRKAKEQTRGERYIEIAKEWASLKDKAKGG